MSIEQVFHTIAVRSKSASLGRSAAYVNTNHWSDKYPQCGYVGRRYTSGGLVFIANNPANGGDEHGVVHTAIENFAKRIDGFADLNSALALYMPDWNIYKTVVTWALKTAGLKFSETAYINMIKWRTRVDVDIPSSVWDELYDKSWNDTSSQIDVLEPGLIVVLGSTLEPEFQKRYLGTVPHVALKRTHGDKSLAQQSPEAAKLLQQFGVRIKHEREATASSPR